MDTQAILKFKEAAAEFQKDPRYVALDAARKANDEDTQLQTMLSDFSETRLELNSEMAKSDRDENQVRALNEKINSLYNGIMSNKNMLAYNQAKEDIEGFMNHVNAILNAAIEGEDPLLVEEPQMGGCGEGGCASCSGCS